MRQARRHYKDLQNMRIQTLILCLFFCVASVFAKDVITKTDGSKIDAKVEEITETVIKFHKVSNPTGPVYTIPISLVATVLYENGAEDTFNASVSTSLFQEDQTPIVSDEELMQMADSQTKDYSGKYVSDADLLKIYYSQTPSETIFRKAKKYRLIGWIGGGALFTVCTIAGILENHQNQFDSDGGNKYALIEAVGIGVGLGGLWCMGFNLKANKLIKQAKQMQSYNTILIENEIMQFGKNSLIAGINIMGNRMVNSHSLGISLGLNF